jgi:hypothetical protein
MAIRDTDLLAVYRSGVGIHKAEVRRLTTYFDVEFVNVDGDTMSGHLEVLDPVQELHAVNLRTMTKEFNLLKDKLNEALDALGNGTYTYKASLSVGAGQFTLLYGLGIAPTFHDANEMLIHKQNAGGGINFFNDLDVGMHIGINDPDGGNAIYEILGKTPSGDLYSFNVQIVSEGTIDTPVPDEEFRVFSIHITSAGVDMNDLETYFNTKYFPLTGGTITGHLNVGNFSASNIMPLDLNQLPLLS